jgi:hypothetical protein
MPVVRVQAATLLAMCLYGSIYALADALSPRSSAAVATLGALVVATLLIRVAVTMVPARPAACGARHGVLVASLVLLVVGSAVSVIQSGIVALMLALPMQTLGTLAYARVGARARGVATTGEPLLLGIASCPLVGGAVVSFGGLTAPCTMPLAVGFLAFSVAVSWWLRGHAHARSWLVHLTSQRAVYAAMVLLLFDGVDGK